MIKKALRKLGMNTHTTPKNKVISSDKEYNRQVNKQINNEE